jgi:hypothetical protein
MTETGQLQTGFADVTTPHGSKPEASGMTLVCRPTPFVRFMHGSRARAHSNWRIAWHDFGARSCFYPRSYAVEPSETRFS